MKRALIASVVIAAVRTAAAESAEPEPSAAATAPSPDVAPVPAPAPAPPPDVAPASAPAPRAAPAGVAAPGVRNTTVSIELSGFAERGLILDVERDLPERHVSVDGGVVLRSSAGGDYTSSTVGVGVEIRYWFKRRAIWTGRPRGSAIGWYVGGRVDLARTSLSMNDMSLGAERQLGASLLGGYRFAPWRGLEIRPYTGIAVRREWDADSRLAAWTRWGIVLGFAAGWAW